MLREEFGIGNSIEEATAKAIELLNCGDADYTIEIIDDVKPKILGLFGGHPAKVRAYCEVADIPEKHSKKKAPVKEAKAKNTKKKETKKESKKVEAKPEKSEKVVLNYIPLENVDPEMPAVASANYLIKVLEKMGVEEVSVKIAEIENGAQLLIDGKNLGVVIGRRGETLDALQYLASFSANAKKGSGYYRVVLDIGNYREKREETLKSLARRMAAQVVRTGRNRSLEPMNPYERRIIHTEVQSIEGVISNSIGDGVNRHVVICPEGRSPKRYDNRRKGNNQRNRKPSNKVEAPQRAPRSDSEGSALYGRIG